MIKQVRCLGDKIEAVAPTVDIVLKELARRIVARDAALAGVLDEVVVADDFPAALQALGEPPAPAGAIVPTVARTLYRETGPVLVLEGAQVAAALGSEVDAMARFVHLLHGELWRIRLHLDALAAGEAGLGAWHDSVFDSQLRPVVEAMRSEYAVSRCTVWSLPADADLMLKHLLDVIDALPAATTEDVAANPADVDGLFVRSLGRIAHLMQTAAHAQGSLAGLERSMASISPDMAAAIAASFFGPHWAALPAQLAATFEAPDAATLEAARGELQRSVQAVFAALGLQLRRAEDGGVWLAPGAAASP
ncbi:hypothetical protein [Denitromonas iodatirespirans]|uniref:Uncharacterized protein n=1 Tax=Denitromonas iodatirespirans TaxID=2795389 RepID=A0A944H772_DENI1|nr:hypothetical protein [Denitromonas iodatirespirans]MBT0960894.1 hypothetical protein [Denitromonas iodatirespirans]